MSKSKVADLKARIDQEECAAKWGLSGFRIGASHEEIEKRMEQGGGRIVKLFDQGRFDEAFALLDNWVDEWHAANA